MTTRITIMNNVGGHPVGVAPLHPKDPLVGTVHQSILINPGESLDMYVHRGQSILINEMERNTDGSV